MGCNTPNVSFDPSGNWQTQLGYFFEDIHNNGIGNITPTFAAAYGGDPYTFTTDGVNGAHYDLCGYGGVNTSLIWWPTIPFALRTSDGYPYGWQMNNAYGCAAFNSVNFVGWPNMYSVENALLSIANGTSPYSGGLSDYLNVEEFDISQELPTGYSTLVGRYMYDPMDNNGAGRDVLDQLRYYMGYNGYSWTQINFSVTGAGNTSVARL